MILQTVDEVYAAGWTDGARDASLTASEIAHLTLLHSPHLRLHDPPVADDGTGTSRQASAGPAAHESRPAINRYEQEPVYATFSRA